MKWRAVALLAVLAIAAFAAPARSEDAAADDEYDDGLEEPAAPKVSAFLLVRRKITPEAPQVGRPFEVTVEIHNAGEADARSVHVKEDAWPEDAFATSGELAHNYAVIPVGATEAFTYSVTPARAVDAYEHAPTFFTYEAVVGEKGAFTTSAAPPLPARVYTARAAAAERALGVGARLTLGALTTAAEWQRFGLLAGGLAAAALAYRTYTAAASARTASKRRSALKGLGITEEELKKGK